MFHWTLYHDHGIIPLDFKSFNLVAALFLRKREIFYKDLWLK